MGAITFLWMGGGEAWVQGRSQGLPVDYLGALWWNRASDLFSSMRMRRVCWLVMTASASRLK